MNIILLSGGSGKRLWPLSNDVRSKQFIKLFKNENNEYESMVQRVYRQITTVDADATVTLCHSKTNHLYQHIFNADLLVTAVGKPKFINCYQIHIPVIDVGINFDENGKICGDCINTENRDVTPVPGGVGLITRCMLLENVCKAAEMRE